VRRIRVGTAILSVILLVAGLVAGSAAAKRGARGATAARLSAGEKKAMRIVAIKASTSAMAGVLVDVTFGGNMEQSLGRGGLKAGLVAVILHPKAVGSPTRYIAAEGAGAIGQTLTRSVPGKVGVVRNGSHFLFFVAGSGLDDVGSVEVKALPKVPAGSRSRPLGPAPILPPPQINGDGWLAIDEVIGGDEKAVDDLEASLRDSADCDRVKAAQKSVANYLARAKRRSGTFDELSKKIDAAIATAERKTSKGQLVATAGLQGFGAPYAALMKAITGKTPVQAFDSWKAALKSAKLDRKFVDFLSAKNDKLITRLTDLKGDFDELVAACESPPKLKPIHMTFNGLEYTTYYKEDATDPAGRTLTYKWGLAIPLDPLCANGFKPNNPEPNYASWYHRDTLEGGPCDHTKFDENGSGHPGDVVVVVSNGVWNCAATYHGSQGPQGQVVDDGPPPQQPCQRVK
jgi:hypothetical protein